MKVLVLLCALAAFSNSQAQSLPFTFADPLEDFIGFGGSSFSFNTDPDNLGNQVGQFFNDGSGAWQGFTIDLASAIDLDFQNTISLDFYAFDPNIHNIVMKLENGVNPDVQVTQNVPAGGGWTDSIVFDFSNAIYSSNGSPINATGTYAKLTIFIDGGNLISGTYLLDNINDGTAGTNPHALDVIYTDLVWEDNFNVQGPVNDFNWHHQTQVIIPGTGWANGEEQHYTDRIDNSYVDNAGFLHIKAKSETYNDQGLTKPYTSARLNSKFAFTYGRVDVRAKLPLEAGTWPAIWMLGKNINENGGYWDTQFGTTPWPACGELDIMEHGIFPGQSIDYINSAIHTTCCHGGNPNQGGTIASDLANNFHVYSINWSPDQITFLLDDVGFYTYNPSVKNIDNWPFFEDQYILLNVAMGGLAGAVQPGFTESEMVVDYVRVYQSDNVSLGENPMLDNSIQMHPNPAQDFVHISSNDIKINRLTVSDLRGNEVLTLDVNDTHVSIDTRDLVQGIYFVKVATEKGVRSMKLVVKGI